MPQPTDLSTARAERLESESLKEFQWVDRFILTKVEDTTFVDFTSEGRAYYQRWFSRYGFPGHLLSSFDTFCTTMREILRLRVQEAPPLDEKDPVIGQVIRAIQAGDTQALVELAAGIKAKTPSSLLGHVRGPRRG